MPSLCAYALCRLHSPVDYNARWRKGKSFELGVTPGQQICRQAQSGQAWLSFVIAKNRHLRTPTTTTTTTATVKSINDCHY
jgi:hypothetical protein